MKSGGNRAIFRRTAWLSTRVSPPYRIAKSLSSNTRCPRTSTIARATRSAGMRSAVSMLMAQLVGARPPVLVGEARFCWRFRISDLVVSSVERLRISDLKGQVAEGGKFRICMTVLGR